MSGWTFRITCARDEDTRVLIERWLRMHGDYHACPEGDGIQVKHHWQGAVMTTEKQATVRARLATLLPALAGNKSISIKAFTKDPGPKGWARYTCKEQTPETYPLIMHRGRSCGVDWDAAAVAARRVEYEALVADAPKCKTIMEETTALITAMGRAPNDRYECQDMLLDVYLSRGRIVNGNIMKNMSWTLWLRHAHNKAAARAEFLATLQV